MITLTLRVRYGRQPPRHAAAWLIPGHEPVGWLTELLHWELSLADVALYRVPWSSTHLDVQGILAIVPGDSTPRVSPRCQPYARIDRQQTGCPAAIVYIPVEARFDPDLTDADIPPLLGPDENVYLWHPSCGLVGFEPGDRVRVADLLQPPPEQKTAWNLAKPGVGFSRRLTAIEADWTPSAESLLSEGKEDIGSHSSALHELPPCPDEPSPGLLGRMASAVQGFLSDLLSDPAKKPKQPREQQEAGPEADGTQSESVCAGAGLASPCSAGATASGASPGGESIEIDSSSAKGKKPRAGGQKRLSAGLLGAVAAAARATKQGLAGLLRRLGKLGRAAGQTRPNKQARRDRELLEKRDREIRRLLHTLKTDPDVGLHYALPMSKGRRNADRPGSKLLSHSVDFTLASFGHRGPGDLWDVPPHLRGPLLTQYRELAGRELRLGRYRRAAYIYAELLGNIELAASALASGHYWREAAVLYRERLQRPDEAARCLEQGGLWTEASSLYKELGEHEKAGDLHQKLDQLEEAQQAYRAALAKHLTRSDYLAAAWLLEHKLAAPEEALAQLNAGWPSSIQAGRCLEELFHLLARHGWHEAAATKIEQLRQQSLTIGQMQLLIDILSQTAATYPDATVGGRGADTTRALVGARLRQATGEEKQRLLAAVRRLVPSDRLLGRDCQRFLRPPRQPKATSRQPAAQGFRTVAARAPSLRLEARQIHLSNNVQWQAAVSAGNVFYAAGHEGNSVVVEQGFWDGRHVRLEGGLWEGLSLAQRPILLAPDPRGERTLLVYVVSGPPLLQQPFPVADPLLGRVQAGTPPWIPADTIAVQRTSGGMTHVVQRQADELVVHLFNFADQPLSSRSVPYREIWPDGFVARVPFEPMPLHARSDATYLAAGDRLVILKPAEAAKIIELPDAVLSLQGSSPFSRTRLVATMEAGAILYWDDSAQRRASLATELARPVAGITIGGWLVVASAAACHVYRTEGHRIRLEADCPGSSVEPLAVLNTTDPDEFALFGADGTVRLYQMPHQ